MRNKLFHFSPTNKATPGVRLLGAIFVKLSSKKQQQLKLPFRVMAKSDDYWLPPEDYKVSVAQAQEKAKDCPLEPAESGNKMRMF